MTELTVYRVVFWGKCTACCAHICAPQSHLFQCRDSLWYKCESIRTARIHVHMSAATSLALKLLSTAAVFLPLFKVKVSYNSAQDVDVPHPLLEMAEQAATNVWAAASCLPLVLGDLSKLCRRKNESILARRTRKRACWWLLCELSANHSNAAQNTQDTYWHPSYKNTEGPTSFIID